MTLFAPRYKRYAAWPAVLWCRMRGHPSGGLFHSGSINRCVDCGDIVPPTAFEEPPNSFTWEPFKTKTTEGVRRVEKSEDSA